MSRPLRLDELPPRVAAVARRQLLGQPSADVERNDRIRESEEQKAIVKEFQRAGFKIYNLSQYRPARVSAGLPDIWWHHAGLGKSGWWESKRQVGAVFSEFQKDFRAECAAGGVLYGGGDRYAAREFIRELLG